ncbi:hypothetical protein V8G54_025194 [Vigna mungo]|uniref:Uncharacterized protein n=1 Tax=Vigna mungo TaxID=3915 RepID=A0AAQ3N741_VIGMU
MNIRMEFEIGVVCDIIDGEDLAVWVVHSAFSVDAGSGSLRKSCDGGDAEFRDLGEIATLMVVAMEVVRDGCHGSLQERLHNIMVTSDTFCGGDGVRVQWRR